MTEHSHDETPPRREELPGIVDELEDDIVEERRRADVPGNADDREATEQVESDDQAPE